MIIKDISSKVKPKEKKDKNKIIPSRFNQSDINKFLVRDQSKPVISKDVPLKK